MGKRGWSWYPGEGVASDRSREILKGDNRQAGEVCGCRGLWESAGVTRCLLISFPVASIFHIREKAGRVRRERVRSVGG